jgi:hypothetical protein
MSNKQTAINWFEEKIVNTQMISKWMYDYLQEAKQMEKEQIKDAFTDGCIGELYELNAYYTSEKYYNQTYKQQDNGK